MKNPVYVLVTIAAIMALVITYLDTHISLGYGVWVLYLLPILIVSGTKDDRLTIFTTAAVAVFISSGLVLSPGDVSYVRIANRISNYIVFWIVTLVIVSRNRSAKLAEHHARELESANRDLESFSYSVSHDLRGPLNTIASLALVLKENYNESLDSMGRECVNHINDGTKKMALLIDDILNLSRVGRLDVNREDINLSEMVTKYIKELQYLAPDRRVEEKIRPDVHAFADRRLVNIALENLLRNAWKYTARRRVAQIEFDTFIKENESIYVIRDNGVGFDNQYAKCIFEPFKRVHAQQDYSGTGIGLSIVRRVIERHGGKVWAHGEEDQGASFYFTLGPSG